MDLQFFLIAFTLVSGSYSLVKEWIDSVENSNCNLTVRNRNVTDVMAFGSPAIDCPPWYYTSEDGKYCLPGRVIKDTISINPTTKQISILNFYCMTKTGNVTVLGGCLYSAVHALQYIPLPCNASELNDYMCAGLNREGKLCGRCVKGFAPSVYSYSMKCVPCSLYHSRNIFKYILIAFGPMSLFIFVVTLCHIRPTSSYLHGFMLFSQIITLAPIMRIETLLVNYFNYKNFGVSVVLCLFSVWNLDFFRLIYTPFCIHPDMTVVQSLALDYLIAFYPFLILLLVYAAVKLYTHSFKPVVYLWGFVRPTIMFFKTLFNIETSFVHSFATVFFLVAIKLQSVSLDLLHFTQLYHNRGPQPAKTFLYLAGDVEYFGLEHWPYGLFALCTLLLFLVFPALLMFFYPCACFQRLLNRLHYNSLALKTIMDALPGDLQRWDQQYKGLSLLLWNILHFKGSNNHFTVIYEFILFYIADGPPVYWPHSLCGHFPASKRQVFLHNGLSLYFIIGHYMSACWHKSTPSKSVSTSLCYRHNCRCNWGAPSIPLHIGSDYDVALCEGETTTEIREVGPEEEKQ